MEAPEIVTCMECGSDARLVSYPPPDEGFMPGDFVVYLCPECGQRLDIVLEESDD